MTEQGPSFADVVAAEAARRVEPEPLIRARARRAVTEAARSEPEPEPEELRLSRAQVREAAAAVRVGVPGTGAHRRARDHLRDSRRRLLRALMLDALPPGRQPAAFVARLSTALAELDPHPALLEGLIDYFDRKDM